MAWTRSAGWWACLALCAMSPTYAGSVGLSWQASAGATGYRVYYGASPTTMTTMVTVGNQTEATLNNLTDCSDLYFGVKAYNGAGESGMSNIVTSWTRPSVSSASHGFGLQGDQFTLTLTGASFQAGAELTIDNPNVFLESVTRVDCNTLQAVVTIEPTAQDVRPAAVGQFTLTVGGPNELTATRSFEVRVDPARFDVNRSDETTTDRLDGRDTVWLARLFGGQEGGASYDPDFDFDGDGSIDGDELSLLAANFGWCWSGASWTAQACP